MQGKMNIALCMNSKYVMPSLVCMVSIVKNNPGPIDFYILYSYLSQTEIAYMKGVIGSYGSRCRIIPIEIGDDVFADSPIFGRAKEAYFRLLIPKVLPKDIERCLYVDGDVLVQGPLGGLYNQSFIDRATGTEKALVVCEDMGEMLFFHKERHTLLGMPIERSYFNSGVLLFNIPYLRKHWDAHIFLDYVKNNSSKLKFLDQDVLNALLYDEVVFANAGLYNYMEIIVSPLLVGDNARKATIIHFLKKPWKISYTGIHASLWWKYGREIYPGKYILFSIVNFLFRKILGLILLVVPMHELKKIMKKAR